MSDSIKVNQDSRAIKPGDWFVAVKGENFDGHDFIEDALARGASGILELEELFDLAEKKVRKLHPQVIAVTGSYGKTTTKEFIYKVLSSGFRGARTKGNLNTPLGVAIGVVNVLRPYHRFFVAEVGMDRVGEIRQSCLMIVPQIGVLTSVGEMHLEKLGSLERIKQAKSELLETLAPDGTAVLNWDDKNVRDISKKFGGDKIRYGSSPQAQEKIQKIESLNLLVLGQINKYAALAAYSVGKVFGLGDADIFPVLEKFKPLKGRLDLSYSKNGVAVIDDTYNAGPQSTFAALEVLRKFTDRRRIAILGDMLELGSLEKKSHLASLRKALAVCDLVVPVGERMREASDCIRSQKLTSISNLFLKRGDIVLVKGSRGMRMERFVKQIKNDSLKLFGGG